METPYEESLVIRICLVAGTTVAIVTSATRRKAARARRQRRRPGRRGRGAPAPPAGPCRDCRMVIPTCRASGILRRLPTSNPPGTRRRAWRAVRRQAAGSRCRHQAAAVRQRPGFGFGGGGNRIIDPPDGKIPYKPEASAKQQDIVNNHMADEPELHCYQSGVPHSESNQFGVQIIQTPGYFVQLSEFMHTVRIIPTDNRAAHRFQNQAVPGRSGGPLGRRHAGC